jgi:hypothetical protein
MDYLCAMEVVCGRLFLWLREAMCGRPPHDCLLHVGSGSVHSGVGGGAAYSAPA